MRDKNYVLTVKRVGSQMYWVLDSAKHVHQASTKQSVHRRTVTIVKPESFPLHHLNTSATSALSDVTVRAACTNVVTAKLDSIK